MKIRELIDELSLYNPDMRINICDKVGKVVEISDIIPVNTIDPGHGNYAYLTTGTKPTNIVLEIDEEFIF